MSILIKGIEMPQEGFVEVLIRDDGTVQQTGQSYRIDGTDYYTPYVGEMPVMYEAVPVPPHGRLVDARYIRDAIIQKWTDKAGDSHMYKCGMEDAYEVIRNAPTIIPASEEGE